MARDWNGRLRRFRVSRSGCRQACTWLIGLTLVLPGTGMAQVETATEEDASDALRERLTEREDKFRAVDPLTWIVGGRPLVLSGEYEIALEWPGQSTAPDDEAGGGRSALVQQLEAELFYSFGPRLSLFGQLRLGTEHGAADSTAEGAFLERGEMWLHSEDIAGTDLSLEIGRLDFEDGRLWWWDDDLDAVRLIYEGNQFELALAVAQELAPRRLGKDFIDPDDDGVRRLIAEASWDWAPNHALELFALEANDYSGTEREGEFIATERADESDARLRWLGIRASGGWSTPRHGLIGYWLDVAGVRGSEYRTEYEDAEEPDVSVVLGSDDQRVRGWAFDVGGTWILPAPSAPRLTLAYASGSGDANEEDDVDRTFRQSGLHGNEVGFGGVERLAHYGALLDPELSNLSVATVGLGISLMESSSLDLVYNRYRLREPADALRDSALDLQLDGVHRNLGEAYDLVLAIEESSRFQLELLASVLRFGDAVEPGQRQWAWGGFIALRIAL